MRLLPTETSLYLFMVGSGLFGIYLIRFFIRFFKLADKQRQIKEKLINKINNEVKDEIGKEISKDVLRKRVVIIKSHKFIYDLNGNIILKASKAWYIFIFIAILIFSQLVSFSYIGEYKFSEILDFQNFGSYFKLEPINGSGPIAVAVLLISIFLIFMFASFPKSKIFDFENGFFYPLKYKNNFFKLGLEKEYENEIVFLKEIYALQILRYNDYGRSYQLNLVLKNGNRIFITDNFFLEDIKKDANNLSEKLGIKIFNYTI